MKHLPDKDGNLIVCSSDDVRDDGQQHKPDCHMVAKVPAYCWYRSCTCGAVRAWEEKP